MGQCQNCRFYDAKRGTITGHGRCDRYPPMGDIWPQPQPTDECGEFQGKEIGQAEPQPLVAEEKREPDNFDIALLILVPLLVGAAVAVALLQLFGAVH